jgi:hypothetical protein
MGSYYLLFWLGSKVAASEPTLRLPCSASMF